MEIKARKLDIIIPTVHDPKFLQHMLDTIVQYMGKDKDLFNVLIIDDCSNYYEQRQIMLQQYDKKLNYYLTQTAQNSGPGVARNLGFDLAKSKFVAYIDDDDELQDSILNFCFDDYDIISTTYPFRHDEKKVMAHSIMNPAYGLIYKRQYLLDTGLRMMSLRYGMEDSIFRLATFLCTDKIYYDNNNSFYNALDNNLSVYSYWLCDLSDDVYEYYENVSYLSIFDKYYWDIVSQQLHNFNTYGYLLDLIIGVLQGFNNKTDCQFLDLSAYYICLYYYKKMTASKVLKQFTKQCLQVLPYDMQALLMYTYTYISIQDEYMYIKDVSEDINSQYYSKFKLPKHYYYNNSVQIIPYQSLCDTFTEYYYKFSHWNPRTGSKFRDSIFAMFDKKES